jgi:hypothetical protein
MFGFGKKKEKEYVEVKGKVLRIGSISSLEGVQKYVILLEGDIQGYISRIDRVEKPNKEELVALTQPGDLLEFKTEKGYLNIVPGTFVNKTLAELGYKG